MSHEQPSLFEMADELPIPVFDPTAIAEHAQQRYEASKDPADTASEARPMGQAERLLVVHDLLGFYPGNNHELNRAFAIKDHRGTPYGTAGYLNEILLHQMKTPKSEAPGAALLSIVSEMESYASKAKLDKTSLRTLEEEVNDSEDLSSLTSMSKTGANTGLGQFVRRHDIELVARTGNPAVLPFNPLEATAKRNGFDYYTASQPSVMVQARIEEVMSSVRLWQAKAMIEEMIDEQSARFKFWAECLSDAKRHSIARGAAHTALTRLGVTNTIHE